MTPEFSVILPTRGDSGHLRAALESALAAGSDVEILLIHDRRAGELPLPDGGESDSRVRCFVVDAGGPAAARNAGLERARAIYAKARPRYHAVSSKTLDGILKWGC